MRNFSTPSYESIVNEIAKITKIPLADIRRFVWNEAINNGWNVCREALKYKIHPHVYDERMENFYKKTNGFIFELIIESCRPEKKIMIARVGERVGLYLKAVKSTIVNVLMIGDGLGTDSIHLKEQFKNRVRLWYFDVPGSKTYNFAVKRFKNKKIDIDFISSISEIKNNFFDAVVCLEVLEHLPNPKKTIELMSKSLKKNGIALVSECFGDVPENLPTHLLMNEKHADKTPFLFLRENLMLNYLPAENPYKKPMEFVKKENITLKDKINLLFRLFRKDIILPFLNKRIKILLRYSAK